MKKIIIIFLLSISIFLYAEDDFKNPKEPDDPEEIVVSNSDETADKEEKSDVKVYSFNIVYKNKFGESRKGMVDNFSGGYLKLQWKGNEAGNQEILIDLINSIRIKGYKIQKKELKNDLWIVYYIPYIFDIKMKNGKIIKDAKGRIPQIEYFNAYNNLGKEKCYTYFVRYWLEDKGMFSDNNSENFDESPQVPNSVIVYIEFMKEIKVFE